MRLNTYGYNIRYNLPSFKNFETVVGVQGIYQTNKNLGEEILIPDAITNDFGLMATTHYHLDKISLQGGIRFDTRALKSEEVGVISQQDYIASIDKNFNSFNAALGVKIDLLENFYARINLASGFRAPNLAELASNGVHEGTNRYEIGNADLNNEQNFQIDTSLEFKNEHFEVFANVFYNHINQYIFIEPTHQIINDYLVYRYTQDDAKLYGGEFGIHLHPHPFDWLHLNSNYEFVIGKQDNGNYLPLIPAHKLTNTLRAEFDNTKKLENGFIAITLETNLKQDQLSEFETPTTSYNLINIGAGGSIKLSNIQLDINLNVNNAFDTKYTSHLSRLKANGILNIGRNFIASLKFSL